MNLTATEYNELEKKLCGPLEDQVNKLHETLTTIVSIVEGKVSLDYLELYKINSALAEAGYTGGDQHGIRRLH